MNALAALVFTAQIAFGARQSPPVGARHVKVYAEPGRFGGWPANHGIWSWGNEILVGFSAGYFKDDRPHRHAIDHDRPEEYLLARSRDPRQWRRARPRLPAQRPAARREDRHRLLFSR